jgi:FkbH-like protein
VYTVWQADVVILAAQTRDIVPELWSGFVGDDPSVIDDVCDRAVGQYSAMIESFRRSGGAHLVIHGLEQPPLPALGLADRAVALGQQAAIRSINDRLEAIARDVRGVDVLDLDAVIARVGRRQWLDEQKWRSMRMPIRSDHMADLANEWLRFIQPIVGHTAKALVVDLDNTLWGGIIGEDGMAGIALGPDDPGAGYGALQRAILDLRGRGIILGVCSKNNAADALEVLEQHPEMILRPSHFSAIRINWESKVANLKEIAGELNIGLDAIAFLDDNPAECELVRQQLPEVIVLELDRVPVDGDNPVIGNPFFERLDLSDEDRRRADLYAAQHERRQVESSAGSLDEYLRSLGTIVRMARASLADIPRIAQLTQKTNQFNMTTRRYTEHDIETFVADPTVRVYATRAEDRFGDHGLIGVAIVKSTADTWSIDTMLLSCRVIGRGVETAIVASIIDDARQAGAHAVHGEFVATPKNAPARSFYESVGFDRVAGDDDESEYRFDVDARVLDVPDWIVCEFVEEKVNHG